MKKRSPKAFLVVAVLAFGLAAIAVAQSNPPHASPPVPAEALVQALPPALLPAYLKALQAQKSAAQVRMQNPNAAAQAELTMLKNIKETLLATRRYLPAASDPEKAAIARVLRVLGPPPPSAGQPGMSPGQPMPQPPAINPADVAQAVDKMFKDVDGAIKRLQSGGMSPVPMPGPQPRSPAPSPGGMPGMLKVPPACSEQLRASEQTPQATDVPCSGKQGNLLFRTVCNTSGYNQVAITLPSGRAAGCFAIEALTRNRVVWGIRVEGGPDVYHSSMGPRALAGLVIESATPSPNGKYTIYLDMAQSNPGASITVRFVDYPK